MTAAALTREAARSIRAPACVRTQPPPLIVIGRPWWLYDAADFPGFSDAEIRAGLTVPTVEREAGR